MVALATLFLPLLVLPSLRTDGSVLLDTMLGSETKSKLAEEYELEAGERQVNVQTQTGRDKDSNARKVQRWTGRIEAAALAACCLAGLVVWWSYM